MKKSIVTLITTATLGALALADAQVTKTSRDGAVIEAGGINGASDFYAQNNGSSFDEYSLTEFATSKSDFGGSNVTDISSATLTLTVNDRFFSASGPFTILFTPDSKTDLTNLDDYDQLTFDAGSDYGIDSSQFPTSPVVVGTGNYAFDGETGGGTEVALTLDLAAFESELIAAINAGEPFHLLIGSLSTDPTVATFSGAGNTYDPGDPTLTITAAIDGTVPEPADYPADFAATATFTTITATWTDVADAAGYVVQISESGTFLGISDGTAPVDDTDLSDGSGQFVVGQGVQEALFEDLTADTQYFFTIFPYSNLGTDADYKTDGTPPEASATASGITVGDVLFTQYYEGSSNNKYLELTNVSGSTVDLNDYVIANFDNAIAEDWKAGMANATRTTALTGLSIGPGQSIIVANPSAATPVSPSDAAVSTGQATFFNGNDSLVLFSDASQSLDSLVDAIPFTNSGFEGGEISFVRLTADPGFDLSLGSSVLDFPSVWGSVDTTAVDAAVFGDDAFLGTSGLVSSPPQIFFDPSSQIVSEGAGTVELTVRIQNPDGNAVDVDVAFLEGSSSAALDDIGSYSSQTVTFPSSASSGDTRTVTIALTDDGDEESTENAVFELQNLVTGGSALIGSAGQATISIQDNDTPIPNLFLSEVADPADEASAKYVEIYNPTVSPINLGAGQWHLSRYSNGSASAGADVALTGTVPAGGTFVVAPTEFEAVNGAPPDQVSGDVNGNGNDAYELRFGGDSSTGVLVDVYGVTGTDGTGEPWEYTDGRAVRLESVTAGTFTFDVAEWSVQPGTDFAAGTPGSHPESILSPPSGVSATAESDSEIQVAFTPVSGNDVVVVFNTSGTFTTPSGAVPSTGDSFAGGTVFYVGTGAPPSHSGLNSATDYYYAFYSTDGTDYSSAATASATTDALAGTIGSEDFSGTPPVQWVNQTAGGVDEIYGWQILEEEAVADGFDGPAGQMHYLVSPAFDFTGAVNPGIEFDYGEAYEGFSLQILYSTDYPGSGVPTVGGDTWTPIDFTFEEDQDNTETEFSAYSGTAALPDSLEGEDTVYLAFLYTADGSDTGSQQWFLDNIVVRSLPAASDPVGDWLVSNGLDPDADLSSDAGDNDGQPLIIEYLVDGDPNAPEGSPFRATLGEVEVDLGDGPELFENVLILDYLRPSDQKAEGLDVELLGSDDLSSFDPVDFGETQPAEIGNTGVFVHGFFQQTSDGEPMPFSDPGAKEFLRLQVTESAP